MLGPNGKLPPQQLQEQREKGTERRTRGDKSRKSRERKTVKEKKGGGGRILSYMSAFLAEIKSRHEDKYWRV